MARLLSVVGQGAVDAAMLLGASALAGAAAAALATVSAGAFAACCYGLGLIAPAAVAALLLARPPAAAAAGLAALHAVPLAFALRRSPRGGWRTARALGASPTLAVVAVLLPPLLPAIVGDLLLAIAALGLRSLLRASH